MNTTQHTPGPWFVSEDSDCVFIRPSERAICGCAGDTISPLENREEIEANARLIAAAPDLLAALIDLKKQLPASGLKFDIKKHFSLLVAYEAAGTAIHKATGQ